MILLKAPLFIILNVYKPCKLGIINVEEWIFLYEVKHYTINSCRQIISFCGIKDDMIYTVLKLKEHKKWGLNTKCKKTEHNYIVGKQIIYNQACINYII